MEKKQKNGRMPYIILAIATIGMLVLLLTIIYFSVLKPQQPLLTVNEVLLQNPNSNLGNATLAQILQGLTLRMNMTLHNPNRGAFYYANVGASMDYKGKELGFAMVPGGEVGGRRRRRFAVLLATMEPAASLLAMEVGGEEGKAEMVSVNTNVGISGDVSVLGSFSHHTSISTSCFVSISATPPQIVTFNCGLDS